MTVAGIWRWFPYLFHPKQKVFSSYTGDPSAAPFPWKDQQVPFDHHYLVFPWWNLDPLKKQSCCMIRKGTLASIQISPTNCWDIVGYDANIWASSTWFYAVHLVESKEGPAEEKKGMVSSWYTLRQPTVKFGRNTCGGRGSDLNEFWSVHATFSAKEYLRGLSTLVASVKVVLQSGKVLI